MRIHKFSQLMDKSVACLSYCSIMIGCMGILAMVGSITVAVLFRYILNAPILFIDEYSGYILVCIAYMGLGYAARIKAHIVVDYVTSHLPVKVLPWVGLFQYTLALIMIGIMVWQGFDLWLTSIVEHQLSRTVMATPLWIPRLFVWVGLTVFALEVLIKIGNQFRIFRGGEVEKEGLGAGAFTDWEPNALQKEK